MIVPPPHSRCHAERQRSISISWVGTLGEEPPYCTPGLTLPRVGPQDQFASDAKFQDFNKMVGLELATVAHDPLQAMQEP